MHSKILPAALLAAVCATPAAAASNDNNVEWDGLSHVLWQDMRPIVPLAGDAFTVEFQAFRGDLTAARVMQDVGGAQTWHAASVVAQRGPYDIWQAALPGTSDDQLSFVIEATDGTDTDYLGPNGASDAMPASGFVLDFGTLVHAPFGATPTDQGVVFKVWSPTRSTCHVRGEFNNWSTANPLIKHGDFFSGVVASAQVGDMYKYFFNNSVWNTDPRAASLNPNDNMNAVVTDPLSYQWQHDDFIADPIDELVIYQLHVGTFSGRNDPFGPASSPSGYRDVAERAANLAELGVNAVMVNPINEFPGAFSGGYNPVSQYAWEWGLGTPDDLKHMVDELHGHGIAVILDAVWNHFSPSDNFLWNFDGTQTYFDSPAQDTPWGAQADFDDPRVFEYFIDSVHHVMGEFRMDGYRHDAVMAMTDSGWTSQWSVGQDLMREMNRTIRNRYADAVSIAEIYIDSPWVQTGIEFDSQYHNEFKEALRGAVFNAGLGNPDMQRLANVIDGSAVSGTDVMNYFELHDDAWPLNGHERAVRQIDTTAPHDDTFARGRTTLAHGIVMFASGIPAFLQGSEWLENDGWEASKIDWSHKIAYDGVFEFFKTIVGLRTSEPALFANNGVQITHVNDPANIVAFERYQLGGKSYMVVASLSNNTFGGYRIGLPRPGTWGVVVNNQAPEFDGDGAGAALGSTFVADSVPHGGFAQSVQFELPARGFLVFEHEPSAACSPADLDANGTLNLDDIDLFVAAFLSGDLAADLDANGTLNLDDIDAFVVAFLAGCG
ncbi:MAG: alpha-amylase family glycosyl hydrolase [Phycisphaerales bacterium]